MTSTPLTNLVGFVILAGGVLLQFLVILSGAVDGSPVNQIYFLQATTTGISAAENPARWTYFAICGVDQNGLNSNCRPPTPALPFDPSRNFGTEDGIPSQFVGTFKYYYLSRVMFAFYLISLFFSVIGLITGFLALCSRLGGYISGSNTFLAFLFQTVTAVVMTIWTVKGRNIFNSNGLEASIGVKAFAFTWTSMACFLISTILFCIHPPANRRRPVYNTPRTRRFWFGRGRSTRGRRGSLYDAPAHRGVKQSYSP